MQQPNWNTPVGSIGIFPSLVPMTFQLSATPVQPAITLTYAIISGSLPSGLSMSDSGLIFGTPSLVNNESTSTFVVRVTDNFQNIRDRTFSIGVSGSALPSFTTANGTILSILDSTWTEYPIQYNNPISTNPIRIRVVQGSLPPGIEINEAGLIRGYAEPPTLLLNLESVTTIASATSLTDEITCLSTVGFSPGRPVTFTGSVLGGLAENQIYYIKSVIDEFTFTISPTEFGPTLALLADVGSMTVNLPTVSVGQPTIRTYPFTLKLESPLGSDIQSYSITVTNQNTPVLQGGPGNPPNTRVPTIYNTRPATYNIANNDPNYGYYVLPPGSDVTGFTYDPAQDAYIGQFLSDNYFSFRILGKDFDENTLEYIFADLPLGLVGDSNTGWIRGTPVIAEESINQYSFSVAVRKASSPLIASPYFSFSFKISNDLTGNVTWLTGSDLGSIFNGTISNKSVEAVSDVELSYRIVDGALPPNLTLLSNGEITGVVANQPTDEFLNVGETTEFSFTIEAYSPNFPIIQSTRTFTMTVIQEYGQPTDILYIKATPDITDRNILRTLLDNESLIPQDALYRPSDQYFGKARDVTYVHAYGINASDIEQYIAAVTKNHYWRYITLGELETAVAKDENGEIIYEVVYSKIIDNLVNPQGVSINEEIYWPRFINLNLGPWYTSVTNIYTSYIFNIEPAPLLITETGGYYVATENSLNLQTESNNPSYYTSLTPGYARILYPNSLDNMRNRVGQVLGQVFNSSLLPLWMTSQQRNGSTLGFTPAWVICYTKPGFAETIKNNIQNNWRDIQGNPYVLNQINFKIDRFSVDKSITYNYDTGLNPPSWLDLPSGTPVPDPLDSKDFYVLFPRKTILPDETQY